ncbi:hypothetical protein [Streptomyces sp. SID5643]|uniref:hypothetical protein n=1 Tax=Streptomyces sp. SID5643 TaxID=2690307 RepID=UPI001367CB7B|nr:hypothetical protein [Streptomyces sp. SID5643]MZF84822.1 hypothetical protein [Streptomyces sp. SID5643]
MQQHECPSGRRHAVAHRGKKDAGQPVVLYGTNTGASLAQRSAISRNTAGSPGTAEAGDGAVLHLPSDGTKITATGSRTVSPGTSDVSTTGYPNFGADFAA